MSGFSDEGRVRLVHGIELFNGGEYFECHEVLEEIWRPARGPGRLFLQSLIHLAVGLYHHRRGNRRGAERQLRKGLAKLGAYLPAFAGVDTARLHRDAGECLDHILRGTEFARPAIALIPVDPR
jgi:hypothetical protein